MNKLIDFRQLKLLIGAHLKEIYREPGILFWGIVFPMVMTLGLGFAFTKKTDTLRKISVVNEMSEKTGDHFLIGVLEKSMLPGNIVIMTSDSSKYKIVLQSEKLGNTTFEFTEMDWEKAITYIKQGKTNVIIGNKSDSIHYYFDPLNPDAQNSYMKLSQLTQGGRAVLMQGSENITPLTLPGSRYIDFLLPGLIAMGIMMSTMWGLSYGMIERRSKKLLRRMVATPMRKSHFLFSFITVRVLMNIVDAVMLIIFAALVFKTRIQGSIPALILIYIAGNLAFAGLAILLSSRTSKTEVGNGLVNVVVMPMMLLSGIFFSYHNFPDSFIPIIQKLPLTMVADGIRSIFVEGAGFTQIMVPSAILLSFGFICFTAGLRIFKWY